MRQRRESGIGKGNDETSPKFSPGEAIRKIRQILRDGNTIFSRHLLDDITSGRHGVSHQDVIYVLQTGEIISPPEWDEIHLNWKYTVEGTDLDEEELRAITIIIEERFSIFVVTAF